MDLNGNNNADKRKVKVFFVPALVGVSHAYPLIHIARYFASHPDVQATILGSSKYAQSFDNAIKQDRKAGHDIKFHIMELPKAEVGLPDEIENILTSNSGELKSKLFRACGMLKEPLLAFLRTDRPDCIVSEVLAPWTMNIASELGIPRLAFNVSSLFAVCVDDCLGRFKPQEGVGSDDEPFILTGLPGEVSMTRSHIPETYRAKSTGGSSEGFVKVILQSMEKSYGMIFNSFHDLESGYAEYYKNIIGKRKLYLAGPVSPFSSEMNYSRSENNIKDDNNVVAWLDSKEPNSVTYVSFGSIYASMCKEQFHEIAYGLEASGQPFIWVARTDLSGDQGEEGWFPEGFEERMKLSNQGLVIKQWAPQQLILSHPNVGAFVTQCGWNSCLEGLGHGVPFITWPLRVEQFFHESLLVDVLRVGIKVGNEEWLPENAAANITVTRGKVEAAVKAMMSCGDEVLEIRKKEKEYAEKSKLAVQPGGSTHRDVWVLVEELKARQN